MQQPAPWLAAGRYEVGEVVGRGGYGMVCRGLDRQTGQQVALKMLSPEAGRDPDVVERMLREQQALVALSGTCAVTAIDLCRLESGAPCLVMEWLDGCDLEQQLAQWEAAGQLASHDALLAMLQPLAQTLERAHEIGIVHRDIKPANIFLLAGAEPGVRLLDFGLSRMKSAAPLTAVGMVMGSPSYIAPETWRGNSSTLDGRADLFALAVIVFRWLTGALPFDAPDLIGKMTAVTSGPRPSAVALRAELPVTVDAWLKRALAVEPSERFATGSELYDALAAALRGEPWASRADASGVREVVAAASEASERKGVLAGAWSRAASLLKRFTAPGRRDAAAATASVPLPPATTPTPAPLPPVNAPEPNPSDRPSIWLDSEELEDIVPATEVPAAPVEAPEIEATPPAAPKAKRQAKAKPVAKAKAKANTKKSTKRPTKAKAARKLKAKSRSRKA